MFSEFTDEERIDYMELVAKYDEGDYSVYTRTPKNVVKTYPHLHTHLLRLGDKRHKFSLFIKRPYINIHK